jgi:hypothetical protein
MSKKFIKALIIVKQIQIINFIKFNLQLQNQPFLDYSVFFLTGTFIGIIKSSGVRRFCPNSKFPDNSSAGLTRFYCIFTSKKLILDKIM